MVHGHKVGPVSHRHRWHHPCQHDEGTWEQHGVPIQSLWGFHWLLGSGEVGVLELEFSLTLHIIHQTLVTVLQERRL